MATFTLEVAIERVREFGYKVSREAVEIMKQKVPKDTGELSKSVQIVGESHSLGSEIYYIATTKEVGGGKYKVYDLGSIVYYGRPALYPLPDNKTGKLWWEKGGVWHSARSVGPVPPRDYIAETIAELEKKDWSL